MRKRKWVWKEMSVRRMNEKITEVVEGRMGRQRVG